jgi:thioredoxin 1
MTNVTILDSDNLSEFTKNEIVVIDVWSPTCGPCVQLLPIFEEVANEFDQAASFGKLNAQDHRNTAVELNVRSIPTLLFYKNGEIVKRTVGMQTLADLKDIMTELID